MGIPVVIGVTGHRNLREADLPQLKAVVREELEKLQRSCPHSRFVMLNSLAAGADTICAQEALSLGMELVCPLPMEIDEYRKTFAGPDLEVFEHLIEQASDVFIAPATEPFMEGRDFRYREAGLYVALHSHVLLALWDGKPATPGGCGTAEVVSFMLDGGYIGAPTFDSLGDGAVIQVVTPRASSTDTADIHAQLIEEQPGSLSEILSRTETFNRDCELLDKKEGKAKTREEGPKRTCRERMREVYDKADRISMHCQTRYLRTLGSLSLFCVLLVLAFLLYDEAELRWMLVVYGVVISAYAIFYWLVLRGRYHEKYIQYRVLAETMRVQDHLASLGILASVGDDFTWTQRHDITWIRKASRVLLVGGAIPATMTADQVKELWIDDQSAYHRHALERDSGKLRVSNRVTQAMIVGTVASFLAIIVLEYCFPAVMSSSFAGISFRAWAKIVWGCLSVVALFVAGYYGRLSFERKAFDHEKMAMLFESAAQRYDCNPGEYELVFRELAREEIIENGNWMSYCKENRPTFNL
ncbi:MAG: hypothetical protein IJH88_06785 [Eggerthellaceae bacterium]|nr:hypothetical protein [Eggerthellaceae bacterium]